MAASAASLYFLHTLVTQYGKDADVTRVLDTRAFYVCPRINPDGAEWALADKPKWIRSSTRPYPYDEEDIEGLTVEDIDGDGRILQMRIPDPNGLWKAHPDEPRLLIRRDPVETGGTYYRLLPEGRIDGYDGFTLRVKKRPQGLDLNRNFPAHGGRNSSRWAPDPIRRRSPKCAPSSTSSRATRTSPAARRFTRGAACCCARSTTSPTTRCTPRTCGSTRRSARRAPS